MMENEMIPEGHLDREYAETIIDDYMHRMRYSPTAESFLVCRGAGCEVAHACPLKKARIPFPEGKQCPVERKLVEVWTLDLMRELEVEDTAYVDKAQIATVVHSQLLTKRSQEIIANSTSLVEAFRGFAPSGEVITELKVHPMLFMFDKYAKTREDALSSLIATREAKSKDRSRESASAAQLVSAVMGKVKAIEATPRNLRFVPIDSDDNDES
jgi:hypothetical protein